MDMVDSPVESFYRGRHILVTGASGFLGKVLVWKLLTSCPDLGRIYLLLRPKRGQDPSARLVQLLDLPIFETMKRERPELLLKLVAVSGDISLPELGIGAEDQQMLKNNVSVVFHSAATIRFNEPLKEAVSVNLKGTEALTDLCLNFSKLEAFVHVSTVFCNLDRAEVEEVVYPPPMDPRKLIQCVESLDEDILDSFTDRLLKNKLNTYLFTKSVTETVVAKRASLLPTAIIRPSIVTASLCEPMPGWVDNLNWPTGCLVAAGKGVLRTLRCDPEKVADLVPADVTVNLMIAVAWHIATNRPDGLPVFNCATGDDRRMTWGLFEELADEFLVKYAYSNAVVYPGGLNPIKSKPLNTLYSFALHFIPAVVVDAAALLTGRKPGLLKTHKKLHQVSHMLGMFMSNDWIFKTDNMKSLYSAMHPRDQETFNFNVKGLDWRQYLDDYVLGIRKYVLKEDIQTLPAAKKEINRLYWIYRFSQLVLLTPLLWVTFSLGTKSYNAVSDFFTTTDL